MTLSAAPKTGFLLEDFRVFHLSGSSGPVSPHYHDFCKILALQKGSVPYTIEGRSYDLLPGDLLFFGTRGKDGDRDRVSHVGIYIGNGQMIHAPQTGDVVKISDVYGSPWYRRCW